MSPDAEPTEFELLAEVRRSLPGEPRRKLARRRQITWALIAGCALIILVASLALAAGEAPDQTTAAATCLKNAIGNGNSSNNCADSTGVQALQSNSTSLNVTCTHQAANQYICDVTSSGPVPEPAGFYSVTFDGKSIVYQRQ